MRPRRMPPTWLSVLAAVALLVAASCSSEPAETTGEVEEGREAAVESPRAEQPGTGKPNGAPAETEKETETESEDREASDAVIEEEPTEEPPADEEEPPPPLELTGEDYERVVRSHTAFTNWLFRHPDADRFDDITHPDCECYVQKELLAHYEEEGLRWVGEGDGMQVHRVEVVDEQARNLVHLEAVFERQEGGQLVDDEGTVHDEIGPREPWIEELVFVREDESSPWKLRDFIDRGSADEEFGDE